jgi:hypothetical protein
MLTQPEPQARTVHRPSHRSRASWSSNEPDGDRIGQIDLDVFFQRLNGDDLCPVDHEPYTPSLARGVGGGVFNDHELALNGLVYGSSGGLAHGSPSRSLRLAGFDPISTGRF